MSLPVVTINLMRSMTTGNDPFYAGMVDAFYRDARRRHPRFPLIRKLEVGIALFRIPKNAEEYFDRIESSARRNIKKARRLGYSFNVIDYNARRDSIRAIVQSAEVRQGPMPPGLLRGEIGTVTDPPSSRHYHDYVYVGVLQKDELRAYAACMVAGEVIAITNIYGHHAYQSDGIVPLMIYEIVRLARSAYPQVEYCMYDKYFGASTTLRRFKMKFGFEPHRVVWVLG